MSVRGENDGFVNAYNQTLLRHWGGNMDIKLIDGAMGAMYVSYYVNKAEPQMLRNTISMLIRDVLDRDQTMSSYRRLLRTGFCVLRSRQQSAHEAS